MLACGGCSFLFSLDGLSDGPALDGSTEDAIDDRSSENADAETGSESSVLDSSILDQAGESPKGPPDSDTSETADVSQAPDALDAMDAPPESADSPSPPNGISRVQVVAPGFASASQVTRAINETAEDLLVAGVYFNTSAVTITVSDSLGNTWTPTAAYANPSSFCSGTGDATVVQIFYARAVATGSNIVTVQQSSGTHPLGAFLVEYSGARASGTLDAVTGNRATSSTANMTAGSLTTTGARDVTVALFAEATSTGIMTPGSGFASVATDEYFYSLFEDDLPAGVGPSATNPSGTEPGGRTSSCWVGVAAAFKGN
jgi:hypothetical protein